MLPRLLSLLGYINIGNRIGFFDLILTFHLSLQNTMKILTQACFKNIVFSVHYVCVAKFSTLFARNRISFKNLYLKLAKNGHSADVRILFFSMVTLMLVIISKIHVISIIIKYWIFHNWLKVLDNVAQLQSCLTD